MYMEFLNKNRTALNEALPRGAANRICKKLDKPNNTIQNILKGRPMMIQPSEELIEAIVRLAIEEIKVEQDKSGTRAMVVNEFEAVSHS